MNKEKRYGLEQARTHLPHLAREAEAGYATVITRHGESVAVLVPVSQWEAQQAQQSRQSPVSALLALRGSGQGLWHKGAGKAVAALRDEWGR